MTTILKFETAGRSRPCMMGHASRAILRRLVEATRERDQPGTYSIPLAMAPSPAEREAFNQRRGMIAGWLEPALPCALETILGLVLGVMRPEYDLGDAAMRRAAYIIGLEGLPAFAAEDACKAALQGRIGDPRFLPKPGELARYARERLKPLHAEQQDLNRILDAKIEEKNPQTPEEREAMLARIRESVRKVHVGAAQPMSYERKGTPPFPTSQQAMDARSEAQRRHEAQERLDAMSYKDDPIDLSEEAKRKLKR